jgi:hypothetical protein
MPKVEIDYSNTIFYKIFCKDPAIKDLYVGLTTNFVQRKHAHKQSCKNEKALNHNCKLYNAIRNAGGWDNWQMEIIAFHNCTDSYEARKKEQEYFESLGATLNSIDPFPKPKIKEPPVKIVKEKKILFCEPCNVHFAHWTTQETHNNTKKHHKMAEAHIPNELEQCKLPKTTNSFVCQYCDFICYKQSNYDKHLLTAKHKNRAKLNILEQKMPKNAGQLFKCTCGKTYSARNSLWYHKQKCKLEEPNSDSDGPAIISSKDLIMMLIKENNELKNIMMEHIQKCSG